MFQCTGNLCSPCSCTLAKVVLGCTRKQKRKGKMMMINRLTRAAPVMMRAYDTDPLEVLTESTCKPLTAVLQLQALCSTFNHKRA